jgi:hypothetical protein
MSESPILLVEELLPEECKLLTESAPDGKNMWLSGIFMQASIKNRNGRLYPINELSTAVKSAAQRIKEQNGLLGELDHPQSLSINLDRVSHVITEMRMEGNNVIGKAKLINTPMGNIAKELINAGFIPGVSSRGAGTVNESGGVSGFQFVTVDIVAQPSAPNAYPKTVFESLEQAKNGKQIMSLAESVRHDDTAQKYFKKEILKWLSSGAFNKK